MECQFPTAQVRSNTSRSQRKGQLARLVTERPRSANDAQPFLQADPPTAGRLSQTLGLMTQPTSPDSKVLFRMPEDDGSAHVETLWATALGNDEYKLDNSPFYAYSVSWEDIVYAPFDKTEGFPTFVHVVKKSGHRTIRVIFDPPVQEGNESDVVLQGLVSLGCTYEGANRGYMAIDLAQGVQLEIVRRYLIDHKVQWEHADPTYAELFPDEA